MEKGYQSLLIIIYSLIHSLLYNGHAIVYSVVSGKLRFRSNHHHFATCLGVKQLVVTVNSGISGWINSVEWRCRKTGCSASNCEGREVEANHAIVQKKAGGGRNCLTTTIKACAITQQITWLLNMLCMYHMLPYSGAHSSREYTHCTGMDEPFLTWRTGRSGRRCWNINCKRGLYSSCHDNSNGWKWKCSPSPLQRLTDIHSS